MINCFYYSKFEILMFDLKIIMPTSRKSEVGILFFHLVAGATERKAPQGGTNVFSSLTGLDIHFTHLTGRGG